MTDTDPDAELDLRARRYEQLRESWLADPGRRDISQLLAQREEAVVDLRALVLRFVAGEVSLQELRAHLDDWAPANLLLGFVGPVGIEVLDRFADDGHPGEVDGALRAALSLPAGIDEGAAKLEALGAYVAELAAAGSALEARRLPYFVSWFWMVHDPRLRPIWPSGEAVFSKMGWLPRRSAPITERYRSYVALRADIAQRCGAVTGEGIDPSLAGELEFDEVGGWLHYAGFEPAAQ